jgi:hypothetical protein
MSHKMKLSEILKATGAKDWKEAVVRLGYADMFGLGNHILAFRVNIEKPEEVRRIVSLIDFYNNFEGAPLAEMLASLIESGKVMYITFGRAYSPGLHVMVKNPEENRAMVTELLKGFAPDELEEYGPYGIRAWWD